MGIGLGSGENRATDAARQAISSPLLETTIEGAKSVLINITGGSTLALMEIEEAASLVAEAVDPEANIIFGAGIDAEMEDQARITVIATGFSSSSASGARKSVFARQTMPEEPREPQITRESQTVRDSEEPLMGFDDMDTGEAPARGREREVDAGRSEGRTRDPYVRRETRPEPYTRRPLAPKSEPPSDDDDLDIPPFLRRRR